MKNDASAIPCVVFDDSGNIIDISSFADRSLIGPGGEALLMRGMTPGDRERLLNLCSKGGESVTFDLRLRRYRRGIAVSRNFGNESFCELYLLTGSENLSEIHLPFTEVFPKSAAELIAAFKADMAASFSPSTAAELLSPDDPRAASPTDVNALTEAVISRLSKRREMISSRLVLDAEVCQNEIMPIETVPFILILTFLLSVLDGATSDGVIRVRTSRYADSYEVILETKTALPVSGNISHVSSLSRFVPRSYIKLSIVSYAAARFGIRTVAAGYASDGILSVSFGKIKNFLPPTEFKYKERGITDDKVTDCVISLLERIIRLQAEEEPKGV